MIESVILCYEMKRVSSIRYGLPRFALLSTTGMISLLRDALDI